MYRGIYMITDSKNSLCITSGSFRWWQPMYCGLRNLKTRLSAWIFLRMQYARILPCPVCLLEKSGTSSPGASTLSGSNGAVQVTKPQTQFITLTGHLYNWRWPVGVLTGYQIVDLITTWIVLSQGGVELNPVFSGFSESVVFWPMMFCAKIGFIGVFTGMLIFSWDISHTGARSIAVAGLAIYAAVVMNNLLLLVLPGSCPI